MPEHPNSPAVTLAPLAPFASLWRNREVFRRVLWRDIQQAFRGSVLGLGWVVLIPLVLVAIYTFVFGAVLKSTWATPPRSPFEVPLIYFCGLIMFGFFMEVVTRSPVIIRDNRTYVTKIVFPVDILCWMVVGTALFKLCVNLLLLLVFLAVVHGGLPAGALWLPLLLLPFVLLMAGLGWLIAATGVYIRDLAHALAALGPVFMFLSPIFYALAQVPEGLRGVFLANPLTFILEQMRGLLFFGGTLGWRGYLVYWVAALAVFTLGHLFFQRLRPGFADVV